jgi:hypothetical protein
MVSLRSVPGARTILNLPQPALRWCRRLGVDRSGEGDSIFLLSSGRSGSTWLGELLQTLPALRVIFEPFHQRHGVPALRDARYTYLEPDAERPELEAALRGLIDGRDRSNWTEQFNSPLRWIYRRRLMKEVRVNLMVPWLRSVFPTSRFVLLLRHPAAVVASQLKGGWQLSSRRLRDQPGLANTLDLQALGQFGWPESGFLSNLLFWAIENSVALGAARQSGMLVLFYEDLCLDPEREIGRLRDYLGLDFPDRVLDRLDRASWSSDSRVGRLDAEQKVSRWTQTTSTDELRLIEDVLDACGLGGLYGREPSPDRSVLEPDR